MNLKTTLLLAVLAAAGAGAWLFVATRQPAEAESPTLTFLESDLKPDRLARVEVQRGKDTRFVLEKSGDEWTLPGKWPVRTQEVEQWLGQLTGLRSRFVAEPIAGDADLRKYGLDADPLVLKLTLAGGKTHTLTLGEQPDDTNRFTRRTSLRLDTQPEVVRLAPGLLAALDRPQEYFQQRRLFPVERVAKDDGKEKAEQLAATELEVKGPATHFRVVKDGDQWKLREPVQDRVEANKLKTILTTVPDLWAEKFVDRAGKSLDDFGLKEPEYVVTVTRPSGTKVRLQIGAVSEVKTRTVMKPSPPGPFGQPPPPIPEEVREEYRYAKLEANEQVFEVKADKLGDVAVALSELRDPQLARFKADDVRRIEIKQPGQPIVLVKEKRKEEDREVEKWRLEQPAKDDAESGPVTELLDKLAGLQARDKEVLDKADPKTVGLDKPLAEVKLTLEEGKADAKKQREIVFRLGQKAKQADKLYVRVDDSPRVNELGDDLLKLVTRPVLAYRNRRVLDVAVKDLGKIEVRRADETFTLAKKDDKWRLEKPVDAEVDAAKVEQLASELGRLEGNEFVSEQPKTEDLEKTYGLSKSTLSAKLVHADAKKPAQTLVVGKQRPGKQDYFARVGDGPVFAVKKELRDNLDRGSLSYRPLQVLKLPDRSVNEVAVKKDGTEYTLKRDGAAWKLTGPFDAEPVPFEAGRLADELEQLRAEKYEAHQAKDLAKYGLDKPYLSLRFKADDKDRKDRELVVGKPAEGDAKGRYAKLSGSDAVFVLADKVATALDRGPLELLKKDLLTLDTKDVQKISITGTTPFALEQKDGKWQVTGSPAPPFAADEAALELTLHSLADLRAARFVAYGPKIEFATYGLDKPAVTLDVAGADKKSHVIALGKEASKGERYARVDNGPAVVVLDAPTSAALNRTHLDFVDPLVLKYSFDAVAGITRQMKGADLELSRDDDAWRMLKPAARPADALTVNEILDKTFRLRAKKIAAYPAKDLKPFGLDAPVAVLTIQLNDDAGGGKHVIKVGAQVKDSDKESEDRYALIDDGNKVAVLPAALSRHLVAPVLYFADRNLASFGSADVATLEAGKRKLTFGKENNVWKVTEPVKADAEDGELDDLLKGLYRLRADEIVAEKGADLKAFGLDAPAAQWRFRSGDKEVLHLVVGGPEKGKEKEAGSRRYAKLGTSDQVFLLGTKLSERALAEYRGRKPWPALDVAQAEQLRIVGGGQSLTVRKGAIDWVIDAEPEVKIDSKAVTDTLDALASLKAMKYVEDHKANLQLYGLQPPAWTVEVKTPAGARTLHLGRTEGESKRFYASVPGSDAVFVLSEADSARVARGKGAFVTKGPAQQRE